MKSIIVTALLLASLAGCATTTPAPSSPPHSDELTLETRRAAHYLDVLREKKNRFWESQGIEAEYQPEVDPAGAVSAQMLAGSVRPVTECDRIAHSDWGASVLYGQSFLGYENYVNTVARCYAR